MEDSVTKNKPRPAHAPARRPTDGDARPPDQRPDGKAPPGDKASTDQPLGGTSRVLRWIPRVLAVLVVLCLVLAAWVWFQILRLVP